MKETWAYCPIAKEALWEAIDMLLLIARQLEEVEGDEDHHYITLFEDYPKGERVLIAPRSIMRMRVERKELPWTDIPFE